MDHALKYVRLASTVISRLGHAREHAPPRTGVYKVTIGNVYRCALVEPGRGLHQELVLIQLSSATPTMRMIMRGSAWPLQAVLSGLGLILALTAALLFAPIQLMVTLTIGNVIQAALALTSQTQGSIFVSMIA